VVVLSTGFGASLLYKAGFEETLPTVQAAQLEVAFSEIQQTEIYLGCEMAPGGFGWVIPIEDGLARIGVTSRNNAHFYLKNLIKNPLVFNRMKDSIIRIQSCPIPMGVRKECVRDRLMVVGEAAGQVKTTTSGGIYYGLLCAGFAAETISGALKRDDLRAVSMTEYDRRWRALLEKELQTGLLLRKFYDLLSDQQIDSLFDLAGVKEIMSIVRKNARFDWHRPVIDTVLGQGFFRGLLRTALGFPLFSSLKQSR